MSAGSGKKRQRFKLNRDLIGHYRIAYGNPKKLAPAEPPISKPSKLSRRVKESAKPPPPLTESEEQYCQLVGLLHCDDIIEEFARGGDHQARHDLEAIVRWCLNPRHPTFRDLAEAESLRGQWERLVMQEAARRKTPAKQRALEAKLVAKFTVAAAKLRKEFFECGLVKRARARYQRFVSTGRLPAPTDDTHGDLLALVRAWLLDDFSTDLAPPTSEQSHSLFAFPGTRIGDCPAFRIARRFRAIDNRPRAKPRLHADAEKLLRVIERHVRLHARARLSSIKPSKTHRLHLLDAASREWLRDAKQFQAFIEAIGRRWHSIFMQRGKHHHWLRREPVWRLAGRVSDSVLADFLWKEGILPAATTTQIEQVRNDRRARAPGKSRRK